MLTNADSFEISFEALNEEFKLELICERQDAQKSHGLCPDGKPDVANLPAGSSILCQMEQRVHFPLDTQMVL